VAHEEDTPVSVLARPLGYTSESAFSNAFKRVTRQAPNAIGVSFERPAPLTKVDTAIALVRGRQRDQSNFTATKCKQLHSIASLERFHIICRWQPSHDRELWLQGH
jgi:AraC-like DNA-binding protein